MSVSSHWWENSKFLRILFQFSEQPGLCISQSDTVVIAEKVESSGLTASFCCAVLLISFSRYNSHTIKRSHLKCWVWWVLTDVSPYVTTTTKRLRMFPRLQKVPPSSVQWASSTPRHRPSLTCFLSLWITVACSGNLYEWNNTVNTAGVWLFYLA